MTRTFCSSFLVAAFSLFSSMNYCALGDDQQKLLASDGAEGDNFGQSVAISGTTAIVGASRNDGNGTDGGAAYLYDVVTSHEIAKLLPTDGGSR